MEKTPPGTTFTYVKPRRKVEIHEYFPSPSQSLDGLLTFAINCLDDRDIRMLSSPLRRNPLCYSLVNEVKF
jgi:hypothetical protein